MTEDPAPESFDLISHQIQNFDAALERLKSMETVTGQDVLDVLLPCLAAVASLQDAVRRLEAKLG